MKYKNEAHKMPYIICIYSGTSYRKFKWKVIGCIPYIKLALDSAPISLIPSQGRRGSEGEVKEAPKASDPWW